MYRRTFPLGNLYSRETSVQGSENVVTEKRPHNLCVEEPRLFRGKGHFFCVLKQGFNLRSGDI